MVKCYWLVKCSLGLVGKGLGVVVVGAEEMVDKWAKLLFKWDNLSIKQKRRTTVYHLNSV